MTSPIDQPWPKEGLERVEACPYCGSHRRTPAYKDVQDWSFYCAPGKWDYWDCTNCQSLYLDPRPTPQSIGKAYARYYTHNGDTQLDLLSSLKNRLRNEYLSRKLKVSIEPRLYFPLLLNGLLNQIGKRVVVPFGWVQLATLVKGRFIDVGCGAGLTVSLAKQLGWDAMGLEIDPAAVKEARRGGLNIIEGTYAQLASYKSQFDSIMCSHVLEHVHDPLDLLATLKTALKPGGVLLLALPNSLSVLRQHFGSNWRGLEAPRHLAIPSQYQLLGLLESMGFQVTVLADDGIETAAESFRIERRGTALISNDINKAHRLGIRPLERADGNDFIKLFCKSGGNVS